MGKRQIRFTGEKLVSQELINKEVNMVMVDGVVHHVKIIKLLPEHLFVEDLRKKKHKIPFKDIYEIILDLVSAY